MICLMKVLKKLNPNSNIIEKKRVKKLKLKNKYKRILTQTNVFTDNIFLVFFLLSSLLILLTDLKYARYNKIITIKWKRRFRKILKKKSNNYINSYLKEEFKQVYLFIIFIFL